jgi:hypothetical protein
MPIKRRATEAIIRTSRSQKATLLRRRRVELARSVLEELFLRSDELFLCHATLLNLGLLLFAILPRVS